MVQFTTATVRPMSLSQQVGSKKAPAKLKIYSINGVKVAEVNKVSDAEYVLAPGMYICNGKKFVIK